MPRIVAIFLTLLVSLLAGVSMPASAKILLPEDQGLVNDGFRHRDRHTGTFLSRDPAGFIDGPNTYNYVRHNPWSAWDPHGLATSYQVPTGTEDIGYTGAPSVTTDLNAGMPELIHGEPSLGGETHRLSDLYPVFDQVSAIAEYLQRPQYFFDLSGVVPIDFIIDPQRTSRDFTALAESGNYPPEVTKDLRELSQSFSDGEHDYSTLSGTAQGVAAITQPETAVVKGVTAVIVTIKGLSYVDDVVRAGGKGSGMVSHLVSAGDEATDAAKGSTGKSLLPGEGEVGTYDDLIAAGSKGDNITPHHIPSSNHMAQHGVSKGDGIAINMEQPSPGSGGRHRDTFTYGTQADLDLTPRQALGYGIWDVRRIYRQDGLYGPEIRSSLQDVIRQNRAANPDLFTK